MVALTADKAVWMQMDLFTNKISLAMQNLSFPAFLETKNLLTPHSFDMHSVRIQQETEKHH